MIERLLRATGIAGAAEAAVWLLLILVFIVTVVAVIWIWTKFHKLPRTLKIILALMLLIGVAYALGVWTPEGVGRVWEGIKADTFNAYMIADGWSRTRPWVGMIVLALLVPLLALQRGDGGIQ